jgi:predicted metal-binding membrane protein
LPGPARRAASWSSRLRLKVGQVPLSLLASLAVLTAAAWALTIHQAVSMRMPMGIAVRGGMAAEGMAGMAMGGIAATGWSFAGAAIFVAVWTVMMIAMMLPAAASMIFMFASAQARREPEVAVPTWIFVAGYILVWAAAGLVAYVSVQVGSELATSLAPADRSKWAPLALGLTVAAAGLYQFTPIKRVCLTHCRSPLAFIALHWRDRRLGALRMGLRHGAYCFGCCWALFAVLIAAGVMSMAWMLLLTLVVFVEKMLPQGPRAGAVTGVALIAVGTVVASGAIAMPGLAQLQ